MSIAHSFVLQMILNVAIIEWQCKNTSDVHSAISILLDVHRSHSRHTHLELFVLSDISIRRRLHGIFDLFSPFPQELRENDKKETTKNKTCLGGFLFVGVSHTVAPARKHTRLNHHCHGGETVTVIINAKRGRRRRRKEKLGRKR